MTLQHFLNNLFDTKFYSLPLSLKRLRQFGGISCLLNRLSMTSRQPNTFRSFKQIEIQPKINYRHHNKKNINKKNIFLQNILLYFITLSFLIKLLLYKNSLRNISDAYNEVFGFLFLMFRIYERKIKSQSQRCSESKQQQDINQGKLYRIKRKGDEMRIRGQYIEKGDIVFYEKDDVIEFNCILLQIVSSAQDRNLQQGHYIIVSQDQTDTGRNKCRKHPVWKADQLNLLDPFIFKNTRLYNHKIWVLICQSKSQPIYERQNQIQMNGLQQLNKNGRKIDSMIQIMVIIVIVWKSINWKLQNKQDNYEVLLQFIYLISCLTLYLSYANYNEIFVLIQIYLKDCITAKGYGYKIMNSRIIQELQKIDFILIEQDCLKNIDFKLLTEINDNMDLKLLTTESQSYICNIFGSDLNEELIFDKDIISSNQEHSKIIEKLSKSKIIKLSQNYDIELKYIIQIFKEMDFQMMFVGNSRIFMKQYPQIVSILSLRDNMRYDHMNGEWVRIILQKNTKEVILELLQKTKMYKILKQLYYTLMFNSCLQIIILLIWALNGCLISLNLNLLIMYFDNNQVYTFYKNIISKTYTTKKYNKLNPISIIIEFNIIILIYYIFMMYQIYKSPNKNFQLFLWLMINRLFRLDGLGKEVDHQQWINRFKKKLMGMLVLVVLQMAIGYYNKNQFNLINQLLDVLLLPTIMIFYSTFI